MSWEYRVFRHPDGSHAIHEHYKFPDGRTGNTENPATLRFWDHSDDGPIADMRWTLDRMGEALLKPVLEYKETKE
jgi:hypothetical protein